MILPTRYLRAAAITAIDAAMTTAGRTCPVIANPKQGQALPFIGLGFPYIEPRHTNTSEGTTSYHSYIVYADDPTEAMELSDIVVQALTDRDSPISPGGGVKLVSWDLDYTTEALEYQMPGTEQLQYGVPIRIKYRTQE